MRHFEKCRLLSDCTHSLLRLTACPCGDAPVQAGKSKALEGLRSTTSALSHNTLYCAFISFEQVNHCNANSIPQYDRYKQQPRLLRHFLTHPATVLRAEPHEEPLSIVLQRRALHIEIHRDNRYPQGPAESPLLSHPQVCRWFVHRLRL